MAIRWKEAPKEIYAVVTCGGVFLHAHDKQSHADKEVNNTACRVQRYIRAPKPRKKRKVKNG